MPSQVLHTLFGEDVTAEIYRRMAPRMGIAADRALEKIQVSYRKAFALGCQGPDIFYHSQKRRPVGLEYGTLLHRRGSGIFTSGLLKMGLPGPSIRTRKGQAQRSPGLNIDSSLPEMEINTLGVYALGFMTHAILDRLTHPFIVYKSGSYSPSRTGTPRFSGFHAFFERIIDVLMLKHLRGIEISSWDQEGLLAETCEIPPIGLRVLLVSALILAFPERAGKDEKLSRRVDNTFLDCAAFYYLTAPVNTTRQNLSSAPSVRREHLPYIFPEELPAHIDFLNLEHRPWYYPAGEEKEDIRSFPEIYAGAVDAAADTLSGIIGRYLEEGFFPIKEAAQAIGNGGLSIVDEAGFPCAPTRTDPLPLDEVLEQQARLRGLGTKENKMGNEG